MHAAGDLPRGDLEHLSSIPSSSSVVTFLAKRSPAYPGIDIPPLHGGGMIARQPCPPFWVAQVDTPAHVVDFSLCVRGGARSKAGRQFRPRTCSLALLNLTNHAAP